MQAAYGLFDGALCQDIMDLDGFVLSAPVDARLDLAVHGWAVPLRHDHHRGRSGDEVEADAAGSEREVEDARAGIAHEVGNGALARLEAKRSIVDAAVEPGVSAHEGLHQLEHTYKLGGDHDLLVRVEEVPAELGGLHQLGRWGLERALERLGVELVAAVLVQEGRLDGQLPHAQQESAHSGQVDL